MFPVVSWVNLTPLVTVVVAGVVVTAVIFGGGGGVTCIIGLLVAVERLFICIDVLVVGGGVTVVSAVSLTEIVSLGEVTTWFILLLSSFSSISP